MRQFFGTVEPVPEDRLRSLNDGDDLLLGDRSVRTLYTPGHASHHLSLIDVDTGVVFTGDALGVHLPDTGVLRPAAPPPEFDVARSRGFLGSVEDHGQVARRRNCRPSPGSSPSHGLGAA